MEGESMQPRDTKGMMMSMPVEERFWSKVRKSDGCWEWTGAITSRGYGSFSVNGKTLGAHIVSLSLSGITVPKGMCACHHCDNKKCVRVDHIFVGSYSDNLNDLVNKGLHHHVRKTECKHGHAFDEANTRARTHDGRRACRTCERIRCREAYRLKHGFYERRKGRKL